jgi:hypothetical protein
MAKLNFNTIRRPVLELTMMDEAKTNITVTTPNEGLVEELEVMLPELKDALAPGDENAVNTAYDLAARLISCNKEGLQVTVDDLRGKYWPKDRQANMENLVFFFSAYMDFIAEINSAKN